MPIAPTSLPGMIENLKIQFFIFARQIVVLLFVFLFDIFVDNHRLDRPTLGTVIRRIALTMLMLPLRLEVDLPGLSMRLLVQVRTRRLRWQRVRVCVARLRG
jgi:hypothetical protein